MRRQPVSIGRSAGPADRRRRRTRSCRARRCRARSGSAFAARNRSDNGPTINCPTAKIARKTVMVDVTAALDTRRSAAIAGSEGRKMLVDRIPVAANAQITALQAVAFAAAVLWQAPCSERLQCSWLACPVLDFKAQGHRDLDRLRCHGAPAGRLHPEQLSLGVVLGMSEDSVGSSACDVAGACRCATPAVRHTRSKRPRR